MDPSMLEIYTYENTQLLEQLEALLLREEASDEISAEGIDEIFRIMHTIKGSSAMMEFETLAHLSHSLEDLFSHIRERRPRQSDWSMIFELVLNTADFIKAEMAKVASGSRPDGNADELIKRIEEYLDILVHRKLPPTPEEEHMIESSTEEEDLDDLMGIPSYYYRIVAHFEPDCKMENVRAFGIVNTITPLCSKFAHIPEDILDMQADDFIVANGFTLYLKSSEDPEKLETVIKQTLFLKTYTFETIPDDDPSIPEPIRKKLPGKAAKEVKAEAAAPVAGAPQPTVAESFAKQSFISVNINKLDKLLNLVGEIVTTESMVTRNPDLASLHLENFEKSAQLLRKLTDELQDVVMSIRMVPVSSTFHKMKRIVRDMSKKIKKEVDLVLIGEETEVDKNIIDHLSDPLMHLIRNCVDHGIEPAQERIAAGKPQKGTVTLEARNTGGDVIIMVSDDGAGLDRSKIIAKAIERGMTTKSDSEISDREAFNFILAPGFSTKDAVTEFSGRGVGMDVVRKNIEKIGGNITVESEAGKGTSMIIKIPLTLAIVDGMKIQLGDSIYILPLLTIRESFKCSPSDIIRDPDGNEMILIRGEVYNVLRLHEIFHIENAATDLMEGIMIMVESDSDAVCLFTDKILGEQQAVVKPIPSYLASSMGSTHGLGGCTILGDGSISLILDVNSLIEG